MSEPRPPDADETHRGAFGEFGGESGGLIERTFRERIVIVGVQRGDQREHEVDEALDELALLVDTAGADVVARVVQRRDTPDPATFVGSGKVAELYELSEAVDADTVVFDDELTPAQQFNLEKALKRSAIDRTAVILDIFAQNASSLEGKAQVELAQHRYRLPRLRRGSKSFSQQSGGLGGARRGPGETQLEIDRRRIQRRMTKLERDLAGMRDVRRTQRKQRRRTRFHTVSLVGYTNAGKSTLLNALTGAGVLVEDRLFATLDATTRRLQLPGGEQVLVSDTVGFIKKLPHQLVESFRSTLEEVSEVELLLHVVDAGATDIEGQMVAVRQVLTEIGAGEVPELVVFNKADTVPSVDHLLEAVPDSVAVSAATGEGLDELLATMARILRARATYVDLLVPYERGDVLAAVHREGEVLETTHVEGGTRIRVRVDEAGEARFAEWTVEREWA